MDVFLVVRSCFCLRLCFCGFVVVFVCVYVYFCVYCCVYLYLFVEGNFIKNFRQYRQLKSTVNESSQQKEDALMRKLKEIKYIRAKYGGKEFLLIDPNCGIYYGLKKKC